MKVLIVGGVAGGASAAARLRRLDEEAEIVILERSGHVSYANCGLPYYVGGEIEDEGKLTLQTPESFRKRFRIDVRVRSEAVSIDRQGKTVLVRSLDDGSEYREAYDVLILSPGARPLVPDMPGMEDPRVMSMRTVEDTLGMRSFVVGNSPRTAIVAGGGYIGLEIAENLTSMGVQVTLVQRPRQVMPPLDPEMASDIHHHLRSKGVRLILGDAVKGFETDGGLRAVLNSGRIVAADMAVIALGVSPDSRLAIDAGLETGVKGTIVVDEHMRTSDPSIFAVGDAVQVRNYVTGEPASIPLAGPANKQGRIAADILCGIVSVYRGSQGSSVIKVFDMTVATTGINEKTAKALGIRYDKVYTYSPSHATYYPGARSMSVKTIFDPDSGRILGAEIVGYEGVDKRIDVIATAIHAGMDVADLEELDLAYAPPYSSAKDPVNMAGFVMGNVMSGRVKQFFWDQVDGLSTETVGILDVRTHSEYARGHVAGSLNIPVDEIRDRLDEIPSGKPLYLICQSGLRSYVACRMLVQRGYDCYNLSGGYRLYSSAIEDMRLIDEGE